MKIRGADSILEKFARIIARTDKRMGEVNKEYAHRLQDEIQSNIMAQDIFETGEYHDSWQVIQADDYTWTVMTDRPDAFRHEFGFVGVDAMGRHYAEPPRPHVRPAQEVIFPEWQHELSEVVPRLWR